MRERYLEEGQEEVKLFLCGASVETETASVEDYAYEADAEEVVWRIKWVYSLTHWGCIR